LFAGLLFSATDGGTYFRQVPGRKQAHALLMNSASREGRAPCRTFPFDSFEKAVLSMLREVDPDEVLGKDDAPQEVRQLETELHRLQVQKGALEDELLNGDVRSLANALRKIEAKEAGLAEKLNEARRRAARPLDESWRQTHSLVDMLAAAADVNDIRLRLRAELRRVVQEIRLLVVPQGHDRVAAVQVWFAGGERHRDYLILHRPARGSRSSRTEGGWWVRTLVDVAKPGKLDLRKRRDAAELEKVLTGQDFSEKKP
jgi:hypothetical protein